MLEQKYEPINRTSTSTQESFEHEHIRYDETAPKALRRSRATVYSLVALLVFSIVINVVLAAKLGYLQMHQPDPSFVGLERNLDIEIPHDDRTIDDPMWDNPLYDWNAGWVALDNKEAVSRGLPTAMRWPWDESKSIYVIHGFHSIHCVFVLREAIMEYRDGREQNWEHGHVTHCLHVLREDTMCNADDTPRYTGKLHAQKNNSMIFSGTGQTHKCRDWSKLREYAIENSACYHRGLHHYEPLLERYQHCPDGSKPWEKMEITQA